jgi:uncharacterized protein (DUF305 family)
MKNHLPALSIALIAAAVALSGCSNSESGSGNGMPSMNHGTTSTSTNAPAGPAEHNDTDTMFAQMMIPHHAQAVEMSDIVLKKQSLPESITALASRIKAAQAPEIEQMNDWLQAWNESAHMGDSHGMPGMMSGDDLARLEAAQGTEAAKLFLTQMIMHHEGAISMAKTESTDGRNADAIRLAKDIVTAQQAEIEEMRGLLGTL